MTGKPVNLRDLQKTIRYVDAIELIFEGRGIRTLTTEETREIEYAIATLAKEREST